MSMSNPVQAELTLDGLPEGAQIVACGIDGDGLSAYGVLYQHVQTDAGKRWADLTYTGVTPVTARDIVRKFDDMVVVVLPVEAGV